MHSKEWRPIPGFSYEANSLGEIRKIGSLKSLRPSRKRRYDTVVLYTNGRPLTRHVHRLVTLAFHGNPPTPKHQVNHIDAVKAHNSAENLEWCTAIENHQH